LGFYSGGFLLLYKNRTSTGHALFIHHPVT
jgi:hypothetical protein